MSGTKPDGRGARESEHLVEDVDHRGLGALNVAPIERFRSHKRAVDLSTTPSFQRKRAELFRWHETIIDERIDDVTAMNELEVKLHRYSRASSFVQASQTAVDASRKRLAGDIDVTH